MLASLSRFQVLTDRALYIIGVRRTDGALEKKTSPDIWWIQKVVVPLHPQLQRKGGRKCPIRDWRLVTMTADRSAHRASLEAYLIPVSYTHLDVYKRQVANCPRS